MGETFYDVLGVGRDASQADIEAAYRERVKETHPDLNDSPDATDAFQRVQTAEEVLGDPDERARYDRLGHRSYTSHFGASTAEDGGGGWDVGSDRPAEEARDDASGDRGRRGSGRGGTRHGDTVGDDGFGFDPGAYDSTRDRDGDGNPTERSYDVSGGGSADGSDDEAGATASASASASGASGAGGATAGANAAGGAASRAGANATGRERADADASESWQERARRTEREWSKATQREARTDSGDDDPGGYSVHDWNDDAIATESKGVSLKGSELVVVTITFLLYPFMVYSTVAPAFPMFVNGVVGLCALALTGYLLTMPRVGFLVFGAWSVLAPLAFLTIPALEIVSIVGLAMLGTTWIPFGYSILFLHVLD